MLKKIFFIFMRDMKVNKRDFIAVYMIIFPLLMAVGINLLSPSINETTIDLVMIENENIEMVEYLENYAKVELLKDEKAVIKRVEKRDNIIGILIDEDGYYILKQGNEPEGVVEYAKMLKAFYDLDISLEDTNAKINDFGKTIPPLKKMLVNIGILLTSVLGGMLIALNIVEEKADNTISAMNVTPISRTGYIIGKSMSGALLSIYGAIVLIIITGFKGANIGQVLVVVFACSLVSILVGFIEGLKNDDVMNAVAGVKMLFLPLGGAIAAIELLSDKWQMLFYWIPFYWTYKANDAVLSYNATWIQILSYTGIVIVLCGVVYVILMPQIKKGLE